MLRFPKPKKQSRAGQAIDDLAATIARETGEVEASAKSARRRMTEIVEDIDKTTPS